MRNEALQKVRETFAKANAIFGREFRASSVRFDLRGRVAGQALCISNVIRLNEILMNENREDFIAQTIPHEVAHIIAHQLYGSRIKAHGVEWQGIMRRLGLKPTRCHNYDTTSVARQTRKFSYFCACQEIKVGPKIHANIQNGRKQYKCRKCGTRLAQHAPTIQLTSRASFVQVE